MQNTGDENKDLMQVMKVMTLPAMQDLLKKIEAANGCVNTLFSKDSAANSKELQNLQTLRKVGLVQGVIAGPNLCFCLNKETLQKVFGQETLTHAALD